MRRNLPQNNQPPATPPVRPSPPTEAGPSAEPGLGSSLDAPSEGVEATVVALNDAGAIYDALATEIRGSAAGWPPGAITKLEQALHDRYGALIGGPVAVRRLVALATEPTAA